MHVLVVGAGIIGVSIAEALAVRGADVTVIDMRAPGRGASQASAGVLAPYIEVHDDSPLLDLCTRSLSLFDAFIARLRERTSLPVEYQRSGTLEVALDDADRAQLDRVRQWLAVKGVAHEWMDGSAVRAFELCASAQSTAGLFIGEHGFVGVSSLVRALVDSARLAGAEFESPVEAVQIDTAADRVTVRSGERHYTADVVVVAAGSWSSRVRIRINGSNALPRAAVRPIRGQLLQLAWAGEPMPSRVVWGTQCYTVPWHDGSLLVGATVEDVGFDERTTAVGVGRLLAAVGDLLPQSKGAAVLDMRVGLRPATADGLPIIGALTAAPRVLMATGHYRNGILLAPLTAELVCRAVLDGAHDDALAVTSPARFTD